MKKIDEDNIKKNLDEKLEVELQMKINFRNLNDDQADLDEEIANLKKGISKSPEQSASLINALEEQNLNSELLINLLNIDYRDERLIEFESILSDLRWSVVIFADKKNSNQIFECIKETKYRGYFFIIDREQNVKASNYNFQELKIETHTEKINEIIDLIVKTFENREYKKIRNGEYIQDEIGYLYFKLQEDELQIDRKRRIQLLTYQYEENQDILKEMSNNLVSLTLEIDELKNTINNLKQILNEEKIKFQINDNNNKIRANIQEIKELNTQEKDEIGRRNKIIREISSIDQNIGSLKNRIKENKNKIARLSSDLADVGIQLNHAEKDFSEIKKYEELILKYSKPKNKDILDNLINGLQDQISNYPDFIPNLTSIYKNMENNIILHRDTFSKLQDDLEKRMTDVKKYKRQYSEHLDRILSNIRTAFTKILKKIGYEGKIIKNLYKRKSISSNIWEGITDDPDLEMTEMMQFGLDIRIKKPGDTKFHSLFVKKGSELSQRHSGGQKEIIMLAYLIAIQSAYKDFSRFYVVDEPTPHMDPTNIKLMMQLFGETLDQIILFTPRPMPSKHMNEIISIMDNKIIKFPNISKLTDNIEDDPSHLFVARNNSEV